MFFLVYRLTKSFLIPLLFGAKKKEPTNVHHQSHQQGPENKPKDVDGEYVEFEDVN